MTMLKSLAAALILAAAPALADPVREAYEGVLTTLGEPPQLVCVSGMVNAARAFAADPAVAEKQVAEARAVLAGTPRYTVPFDDAAAARIGDAIAAAVSSTPGSEALAPWYREPMQPAVVRETLDEAFGEIGLSPDSAIDVTAYYLAFAWGAQEGDFFFVDPEDTARTVGRVRDQIALAEAQCFQLGAIGDDLTAARDLMLVRSGFLIDGLEENRQPDERKAFGDYIRATSGRQIEGLRLGPNGFE